MIPTTTTLSMMNMASLRDRPLAAAPEGILQRVGPRGEAEQDPISIVSWAAGRRGWAAIFGPSTWQPCIRRILLI
jgi:hypothetical protein